MSYQARITETEWNEIDTAYQNGVLVTDICAKYQLSFGYIHRKLRKRGISKRPRHKMNDELLAQAISNYKQGMTAQDISKQIGVGYETLRKFLVKNGITLTASRFKFRTDDSRKKVAELYLTGQSQQEIADLFGVQQTTISKVLRRQNIRTRQAKTPSSFNWKGGKLINSHGYVEVYVDRDNIIVSETAGNREYILEHRLVMAEYLGRPLGRYETVHHINGIKTDNRIENLQLRQGKHGAGVAYCCLNCGSNNVKPVKLK